MTKMKQYFLVLCMGLIISSVIMGCAGDAHIRYRSIWSPEVQSYEYSKKSSGDISIKATGSDTLKREDYLELRKQELESQGIKVEIGETK